MAAEPQNLPSEASPIRPQPRHRDRPWGKQAGRLDSQGQARQVAGSQSEGQQRRHRQRGETLPASASEILQWIWGYHLEVDPSTEREQGVPGTEAGVLSARLRLHTDELRQVRHPLIEIGHTPQEVIERKGHGCTLLRSARVVNTFKAGIDPIKMVFLPPRTRTSRLTLFPSAC